MACASTYAAPGIAAWSDCRTDSIDSFAGPRVLTNIPAFEFSCCLIEK
jgi:hypothetical protein